MSFNPPTFKPNGIEGVSCGFNVKIRLTPAERIEIYLQNRVNNDTYSATIKTEDIKKENLKNVCDLFIETPVQLYQYIQALRAKQIQFQKIVQVDSKGKVLFRIEVELGFGKNPKRRTIVYEFPTILQNVNTIEKLRNQINSLLNEKSIFQKSISKRMEELEQESKRMKKQIENLQKSNPNLPIHSKNNAQIRFVSDKQSLIAKNGVYVQTANKLNILLIGETLSSQPILQWKVMVWNKMVLIFGVGTPQLTNLKGNALTEEIEHQKLLTKEYFNGGEIITCTFAEGELKYVIEKVDIEEDEGTNPEPNYNMRRGSFMCKHLPRLDLLFPCFGLHFGGRIEILSFGTKAKN